MQNASIIIAPKRLPVNVDRRFKHGDVREDGFIFLTYSMRKRSDGSVYVRERWASPEGYSKHNERARRCAVSYHIKNRERVRARRKAYKSRPEVAERIRAYAKERAQRPEVKERARQSARRQRLKPGILERERQRMREKRKNLEFLERERALMKEYRSRPEVKEMMRQKRNEPAARDRTRELAKLRLRKYAQESAAYRLARAVRARVHGVLKKRGAVKSQRTYEYVGCSAQQLAESLEARFEPGMTWDNYGTAWHVDHIIPVSVYDLTDAAQQRQAFHYTNLQPLWAHANMAKSDTVEGEDIVLGMLAA
jgi:quinol monooxygenase YgiN